MCDAARLVIQAAAELHFGEVVKLQLHLVDQLDKHGVFSPYTSVHANSTQRIAAHTGRMIAITLCKTCTDNPGTACSVHNGANLCHAPVASSSVKADACWGKHIMHATSRWRERPICGWQNSKQPFAL